MNVDELRTALDEVVAEAESQRRPPRASMRPDTKRPRAGFHHLDDEDLRLPPIRAGVRPAASVAEALERSGAGAVVPVWYAVRETAVVLALFWLAIIVLAFAVEVDSLTAPFAAALVARGLWLTATRVTVAPSPARR